MLSPVNNVESNLTSEGRAIAQVFFLIRIVGGGGQTGSTQHVFHWMAYCTCPGWLWWWRILVEWRLAGETEVFGENLPPLHFVHQKSHLTRPGFEPGPPRWEAQAVSPRLPTAAARVRALVSLCRICSGQSGTGAGFLRVLRLPLPILIPPTAPHSSSVIWSGTIGQLVTDVPSGLSLSPPQDTKKN
jgi:hypothetical protein